MPSPLPINAITTALPHPFPPPPPFHYQHPHEDASSHDRHSKRHHQPVPFHHHLPFSPPLWCIKTQPPRHAATQQCTNARPIPPPPRLSTTTTPFHHLRWVKTRPPQMTPPWRQHLTQRCEKKRPQQVEVTENTTDTRRMAREEPGEHGKGTGGTYKVCPLFFKISYLILLTPSPPTSYRTRETRPSGRVSRSP